MSTLGEQVMISEPELEDEEEEQKFARDRKDDFYQPTNFCDELFQGRTELEQNRHYQTCMFAYN